MVGILNRDEARESVNISNDASAREEPKDAFEGARPEQDAAADSVDPADPMADELRVEAATEDPLLERLEFLTRHHGRPHSADVLKAGLPLEGDRLNPALFIRAAERAGFKARVVKRRLSRVSKHVLPAVLALQGGGACLLMGFVNRGRQAQVMTPESGGGVETVLVEDLQHDYTGYAIYVRPIAEMNLHHEEDDGPKPRAWFWGVLFRNWWTYAQVGVAALLINIFALVTPLFIMTVYDRVIPNSAFETLYVLAIGMSSVLLFDFLLKSLRGYFIDSAGKQADVMLACRIFDQVLDMRMSSRPNSAGAFANTLREFETLRDFFTSATLATLVDMPFIGVFILVIWLISGPVALVLAVAVPLVLTFGLLIQVPLNFVVRRNFRESQQKHGVLVETISGLETIKSIGAEGRVRGLWEAAVGLTAVSGQQSRALSLSAVNFSAMIQQMSTVGVIVYGVHLVAENEITIGALIACVMLGSRAIAPLGQVAQLLTRFHQSMASLDALDKIMKTPVERPSKKSFLHRPKLDGGITFDNVKFNYPGREENALRGISFSIEPGEHVGFIGRVGSGKSKIMKTPVERPSKKSFLHRPKLDGGITFDNVKFNYPGREENALRGISFSIEPGEHVGFIGRVGSGKSTIAKLVLALFEPEEGTILIDGTDIRQIDPVDLRSNIGYVPQDVFLFRGTVRENITAAAPYTDDTKTLHAARLAGADEFVRQNPMGYDFPIGERGDGLSGGQRQSITIARALIGDPSIAVMDEPTSAMDVGSETAFKLHLKDAFQGKTLLLMTHRSTLLSLVDRVIILDGGRIVGDGSRESILRTLAGGGVKKSNIDPGSDEKS